MKRKNRKKPKMESFSFVYSYEDTHVVAGSVSRESDALAPHDILDLVWGFLETNPNIGSVAGQDDWLSAKYEKCVGIPLK